MTDSNALFLTLDQGGSSSRANVYGAGGALVAFAQVPVGEARSGDDRVEQDPEELVRSLRRATKDAMKRLGARVEFLRCAGLATQRASCVAWNRETGAALTPVYSWQDRRAHVRVEALSEHADEVRRRTGLRLSAHYGASKMAWAIENVTAVRDALAAGTLALGPLASFLAFRLLDGSPLVADPANASRTQLVDLATGKFDPWLADLFGVPLVALPRTVDTRGEHGVLDVGKRKIPLRVLTGDQSAALFSGREPSASDVHVTFGTGAFVQRALADASIDAPRLLKSVVLREGARSTCVLEGTINGAGSALAWCTRELGLGELDGTLEGWLDDERDPPLFLNGVGGLAAPWWKPSFVSRFVGDGTPRAKTVAVLESTVFLSRAILDEIAVATGPFERLKVGGGLSQLDGLCERLASLARAPVERSADVETTSRGLAHLLGAAITPLESDVFEPEADAALEARYAQWLGEMERAVR